MDFDNPTIVFTAETNVESHQVVDMLRANDIQALADEDQSGVSLWAFGTISQFHKPNVFVDETDVAAATILVNRFEKQKRERSDSNDLSGPIVVTCEDCEKDTTFPGRADGTTQECSHCGAYVDVGEFEWDQDVGAPEEE